VPSSSITVGANTLTLIPLPSYPPPKMTEFWLSDKVASVSSIFTGQIQTQTWPGADTWGLMVTMPVMVAPYMNTWKSFLMQLRGMERVLQLPDYQALSPRGNAGAAAPVVDSSAISNNIPMSRTLFTRNWPASVNGVLLPGDALQIGCRMYYALDQVNTDADGNASFEVFPSIRERPADATAILLGTAATGGTPPMGLFRLAQNRRSWSEEPRITNMSFPVQEYR
jgi:hypothetical protein